MGISNFVGKIKIQHFYLVACIVSLLGVILGFPIASSIATLMNATLGLYIHSKDVIKK